MSELAVCFFEDDPRYRASLELVLKHTPGVRCVASFPTLASGLAEARRRAGDWDLVLMDLHLPDGSGIEGVKALKALRPGLPVVVLTVFEDPRTVLRAICAGADGYLLKRATAAELVAALKAVAAGGSPLTPAVAASLLEVVRQTSVPSTPPPSRLDLTERERDVLRSLAAGNAYKQVADDLGVSLDTVRSHVRALYRKLQVHSVAEAVGRALREGLV